MTLTPFEPTGPRDRRLALGTAPGALALLNAAGWVEAAEVHVTTRIASLVGEADEPTLLAVALTVRAAREGSACLDADAALDALRAGVDAAPDLAASLPDDVDSWLAAVRDSSTAAAGVVRVEHGLVYLDRYHREEVQVATDLATRAARTAPAVDDTMLEAGLRRVFDGATWEEQRAAVRRAAGQLTTVLVGGPGTGKTSTVAGLLTLLLEQAGAARAPRIALAAPTGKAAARLRESVLRSVADMPESDRARLGEVEAVTLHRLLGWRPDSRTRFRRDRTNPLPHDIVVVDEASMLSLTMTARLLEALRPSARLVLVGDPDQLASVEAGAVLADLVAGYGAQTGPTPVVGLTTSRRFGMSIGALAAAVRDDRPDDVMELLRTPAADGSVDFIEVADAAHAEQSLSGLLLGHADSLRRLAFAGDVEGALEALGHHRLLCAHRDGPWGVASWNRRVDRWLAEAHGYAGRHQPGRPLLVTANDYRLGLSNGDTGVVALREDGRVIAAFGEPGSPVVHGASALADAETAHAMTIHKSQGSQARHVTVLLPDAESRLLTRELLYTAITRAEERVAVVGSEEAIRGAVGRRTARASGLRHRLA